MNNNFYYQPKFNSLLSNCVEIKTYLNFVNEINLDSNLSTEEKEFLKLLASKFIKFKYAKLADYYVSANEHMQMWLENLRAVIIDEDRAIERGLFDYFTNYDLLVQKIVSDEYEK